METQIKKVTEIVREYLEKNNGHIGLSNLTPMEMEHVVQIGTSILCTKWDIGYEGGSFVKAVVNNNLSDAIGYADSTNIKALKFYCQLMYNVGKPVIFDEDIEFDEDHALDKVLNNIVEDFTDSDIKEIIKENRL